MDNRITSLFCLAVLPQKIVARASLFWGALFASGCIIFGLSSHVQAEYAKTPTGVAVKVGDLRIKASAVSQGIFRLQMAFDEDQKELKSTFLANFANVAPWELVVQGDEVGVKNPMGQLLIDQKTGNWRLSDLSGATIAKGLGSELINGGSPGAEVEASISLAVGKEFRAYGSGNGNPKDRQLLKTEGLSRLENGVSVIPYYWTDAGYGAFGVSEDDDKPAKWKADSSAGKVIWRFPGKTANLFLMPAADLYEAVFRYAQLTGRASVPPRWSFGYLQSRWGWVDKAYIDEVLKNFHQRDLPVDAFILDFECYTTTPDYKLPESGAPNYSDFDWNPALLPDAPKNFADYAKQGLRIVPIRKPRIGNEDTLRMMRQKGWIKPVGDNGEKTELMNQRDLDFRLAELRDWYAEKLLPMRKAGVVGWWNDEGESSYTKYFFWNLAQVDMLKRLDPNLRHWSLNRSFSPGMQRLDAAAWTGDVASSWAALAQTPASLLNWGLAGMPHGSCDIGGYKIPKDADGNRATTISPTLMTRWLQAGVFFPIMRAHSALRMTPHFPWLYGAEAESAMRKALQLRYRLIPFYYSLAHETFETGAPIMRPLAMEFPRDKKVENMSDQWLMGKGLMVAPLLTEKSDRAVYFPSDMQTFDGTRSFKQGEKIEILGASLDEIPIYVRNGTILPLAPALRHTGELPGGPLEVRIYPGADGAFTFVEDDGLSRDYLLGKVRKTRFLWDDNKRAFTWSQEGSYVGKDVFKKMKVVLLSSSGLKTVDADLAPAGKLQF